MAKFTQRKKRKASFLFKSFLLMLTSIMFLIFSSIFIGSKNTLLTIEIQEMNARLDQLKAENQQLNIDIQTLQNKDRIYTMAFDSGLKQNQDNIVNVNQGYTNEAE